MTLAEPVRLGFSTTDVVVITGAASGIGRETALLAAQAGLQVCAWDLNTDGLAQLQMDGTERGLTIGIRHVDISDATAVQDGMAAAATIGPVRYLVNNAGPSSLISASFMEALDLAVGSLHWVTEAWMHIKPPSGCSVVSTASVAGTSIGTASDWYCTAKAGIAGYTRHLAVTHPASLRANAVAPGLIDTPRMAAFAESDLGQKIISHVPLQRMGQAHEVASAIVFLLSPMASYINGVVLTVDGGWTVNQ